MVFWDDFFFLMIGVSFVALTVSWIISLFITLYVFLITPKGSRLSKWFSSIACTFLFCFSCALYICILYLILGYGDTEYLVNFIVSICLSYFTLKLFKSKIKHLADKFASKYWAYKSGEKDGDDDNFDDYNATYTDLTNVNHK